MLKKCDGRTDGRTNERTDEKTDLCIELRYAQLKMIFHGLLLLSIGCAALLCKDNSLTGRSGPAVADPAADKLITISGASLRY